MTDQISELSEKLFTEPTHNKELCDLIRSLSDAGEEDAATVLWTVACLRSDRYMALRPAFLAALARFSEQVGALVGIGAQPPRWVGRVDQVLTNEDGENDNEKAD